MVSKVLIMYTDGRLTSAWNWCSKVEKKPYFSTFQLAGFMGFDGKYDE